MQNKTFVRRTVILYLSLYTIFIVVLSATAGSGDISYLHLLWIIPVSIYTAKIMINKIGEAIEQRSKGLTQLADALGAMSVNLNQYAKELELRANMLNKGHAALKSQVDNVNRCNIIINDLLANKDIINSTIPANTNMANPKPLDFDDYNAG